MILDGTVKDAKTILRVLPGQSQGVHRAFVTPIFGQWPASGQREHLGLTGVQTSCPKDTSSSFIGIQCLGGMTLCSAFSVSSGLLVFTQPIRLAIWCTWQSTQSALMPKPRFSVRLAVLIPRGKIHQPFWSAGTAAVPIDQLVGDGEDLLGFAW
jgi:hypothetical protein